MQYMHGRLFESGHLPRYAHISWWEAISLRIILIPGPSYRGIPSIEYSLCVHISLTDTTLTYSNLSTVLNHVVDMVTLMDCLNNIPGSVRRKIRVHSKDEEQQRKECIHYYLKTSPYVLWGWGHLWRELHFQEQEAALTAAKAYFQRAPGTCGCGMCTYVLECRGYLWLRVCSKFMPAVMYIVYNNYNNAFILITLVLTDHICAHVHLHTYTCLIYRAIIDTRYSIYIVSLTAFSIWMIWMMLLLGFRFHTPSKITRASVWQETISQSVLMINCLPY